MAEPTFRPMTEADVSAALAIIADHDADDFEWAAHTYRQSLVGQFVLECDRAVVGVTGATPIPDTDRSWGISWTYLQNNIRGRGLGRTLLDNLVAELKQRGARKAFVNTSDYYDPEDGDIYRNAREAYLAVGFTEEAKNSHFYDHDESQISYSIRLEPPAPEQGRAVNSQNICLTDVDEISECEGAYWLAWELDDQGTEPADFKMISEQVRQWEGRVIFMALPSDLIHAPEFMNRCRFRPDGTLTDYYEDGIDRMLFRYNLS